MFLVSGWSQATWVEPASECQRAPGFILELQALFLAVGPINPVAEGGDGSVVQEQGDTAVAGIGLLGLFWAHRC